MDDPHAVELLGSQGNDMETDGAELLMCRFCLEEGTRRDFIAPCSCRGSSRWVHRACLNQWRCTREDKAFSQCTECKSYYDMVCISNDTFNEACLRRTRFCGYLSRDLILLVLASHLVIALSSGFVFLIDVINSYSLFHSSKMQNEIAFYYLSGWFLALAVVGMVSNSYRNQRCESCHAGGCDRVYCGDIIYPFYCYDSPNCCCCGPHCEVCAGPATCECGECTAAAVGQDVLAVIFGIFVIMAMICVFVAVMFGFIILQHLIRRHIHILNKWNLTQEYIVRDLAPGGLSVEELLHEFTIGRSDNNRNSRSCGHVFHLLYELFQGGPSLNMGFAQRPRSPRDDVSDESSNESDVSVAINSHRHAHSSYTRLESGDSLLQEVEMTEETRRNPITAHLGMERERGFEEEGDYYVAPGVVETPRMEHLTEAQRSLLQRQNLL